MGAVALFSGGKDSTRAIQLAMEAGLKIDCLLTAIPARYDSYMFHSRALNLVHLQSEAMGIPVTFFNTSGVKEEELGPLKEALTRLIDELGIKTVVAGALRSNYQRLRIEELSDGLGLDVFMPLWNKDGEAHLRSLLAERYDIMMVAVAAEGLDRSWLGRHIDDDIVLGLSNLSSRYGINIDGEGGEYETSVLYAPFFKMKVRINGMTTIWDGSSGYVEIENATLI